MMPGPPPAPDFKFGVDPSVSGWQIPMIEWLVKHDKSWNGLAGSCLVFDPEGRVLVIQRAAHDSMANLYELPGGGVDRDDPTVLHGAGSTEVAAVGQAWSLVGVN